MISGIASGQSEDRTVTVVDIDMAEPARMPVYEPVNLPLPPPLDVHGDLATVWKRFQRAWNNYEVAARLDAQPIANRLATLKTCVWPDALDVVEGFTYERPDDANDIGRVLEKLELHCVGMRNEVYERYVFNKRVQEPGESFEAYTASLRTLIKSCNFGQLEDALLRDRIAMGIRENGTRKRLLQEPNLTLNECIRICCSHETTSRQIKVISGEAVSVDAVTDRYSARRNSAVVSDCRFCGRTHKRDKRSCFAWGRKCNKCSGMNHFALKCRKGEGTSLPKSTQGERMYRRDRQAHSHHSMQPAEPQGYGRARRYFPSKAASVRYVDEDSHSICYTDESEDGCQRDTLSVDTQAKEPEKWTVESGTEKQVNSEMVLEKKHPQ